MKKMLLVTVIIMTAVVFSGCAKSTPIHTTLPVTVNLTANDLNIGEKVEYTLPYDEDDKSIISKLHTGALQETGYDFLILPQYEIKKNLLKTEITLKAYGATLKR